MRTTPILGCAAAALALAAGPRAAATPIFVPNASFEAPTIRVSPFARPDIEDWQEAPPPAWWASFGYTPADWDNATGVFYNVPAQPSWIDNVDGEQAAFLFSTPEVELFQELETTYETGTPLRLTAAFQGGGQNMPLGATLELRLYYRDGDSNRLTVGAVTVINDTDESQPHEKHLTDWSVEIPAVGALDPWAGRSIGIQIVSTVSLQSAGGFWRVDHVRLEAVPEPATLALVAAGALLAALHRKGGARHARDPDSHG